MDLNFSLGYLLNTCAIQIKNQLTARFRNSGYQVTSEQFAVLQCLENHPKSTQTEISSLLKKDKTNLTRILDTMIKHQWIQRVPHETDRRSFRIEMLKNGNKLLNLLKPLANAQNQESLAVLSSQGQSQLIELLQQLNHEWNHEKI